MSDAKKKIALIVIGCACAIVVAVIIYQIIANVASPVSKTPPPDASASPVQERKPAVKLAADDSTIKNMEEAIAKDPDSLRNEDAYWKLAALYDRKQDIIKSTEIYKKILEKFPSSDNVLKAQEALDNNNVKLLFSDIPTPDSITYVVQKGDNLFKIAKKLGTTVELIKKANKTDTGILRTGRKLKVTKLKFSIAVDKSQNILTLKADGNVFKTYRVSTGKNNSTPVGTFKIVTKIVNPPWYQKNGKVIPSGDPKNELGTRWLGISKPSYGIHGTIHPEAIGQSVTEGCVRMRPADVEELYAIVPEGTEVVIVD